MTPEEKIKLLKQKKDKIQRLRSEMDKINKRITEIAVELDDTVEEIRDIMESK